MSSTLILLLCLVTASPVFLVFDTPMAALWLTLWTAVMLGITGMSLRPTEAEQVSKTVRILVPLAAVPAIWMVAQILPTPFLAHPIWQSAAGAVDASLSGKISADPGLTFQALLHYLTLLGIALTALCVTIDRRRAHHVLRALVAVTGLVTAAFIVISVGEFRPSEGLNSPGLDGTFVTICNLGILLSASLLVSAIDQYQIRRQATPLTGGMIGEFCVGAAVFVMCFATAAKYGPPLAFIAGLCCLLPVFLVAFLRHVTSHAWEKSIVVGIAVIVAAGFVVSRLEKGSGDITLRAASAIPAQTSIATRMMSDAGPLGTGAGTYAALVPIYRGIDDPSAVFSPPSVAAAIVVELGRSALAVILAIGAVMVVVLFRRALARGRDSLYAAAGSGYAVLMMLGIFCDGGLAATSSIVLGAVTLGLALGQSLSLPRN